ncbi:MAG: hypothetical protein V1816_26890 [Pseudomonadota bacterium]
MSDPIRVAFVVEGPTDFIILRAIVERLLKGNDFVPQVLQPEISDAFKITPGDDGGWPGIYRWCRQAADQGGGNLDGDFLFTVHDLLIFQIDADVAGTTYAAGHIKNPIPGASLPCEEKCPPASTTTNNLRNIVSVWLGGNPLPQQVVMCIPSKALETWVLIGMFPSDAAVVKGDIECRDKPGHTLRSKPKEKRLISGNKKIIEKYEEFARRIAEQWSVIREKCTEARRFETELSRALTVEREKAD